MSMDMSSPPASSPTKRRHSPNLSLDLDDLPPLVQPTPPTNTLIITNLADPVIFTTPTLASIKDALNAQAPLHTFSPLKSFRRIIVSFHTIDDAIRVRTALDGETVLDNRVRVYFGQTTKIDLEDQHLQAPKSNKLFFISPPPSPPMGWEMRNEDPPNKEVHAEDLASALSKLQARPEADEALHQDQDEVVEGRPGTVRTGSGGVNVVYDPQDHGHSPDLPAIAVVDTSESPGQLSPMEGVEKKFVHTSRPPVELMER
ncbi:hypothetical protein MBLNU230_g6395t1 [Neophaeotheca triangularis]